MRSSAKCQQKTQVSNMSLEVSLPIKHVWVSHQSDTGYFNSSDKLKGIFLLRMDFFRSRAYTQKESLEVTFFPYVRLSANFAKFNFSKKLNYGTHHIAIYGALVNRKWVGSGMRGIYKRRALAPCDFLVHY